MFTLALLRPVIIPPVLSSVSKKAIGVGFVFGILLPTLRFPQMVSGG
jgi:hypothetical protein